MQVFATSCPPRKEPTVSVVASFTCQLQLTRLSRWQQFVLLFSDIDHVLTFSIPTCNLRVDLFFPFCLQVPTHLSICDLTLLYLSLCPRPSDSRSGGSSTTSPESGHMQLAATTTADAGSAHGQDQQPGAHKRRKRVTGRRRTVMSEAQLRALNHFYQLNKMPETDEKLAISSATGLPLRVVSIWFQNKRCKDKKKRLKMATEQQPDTPIDTQSALLAWTGGPTMHSTVSDMMAATPEVRNQIRSACEPLVDIHVY